MEWSQSKFNSFIKGALRSATLKWPPKHEVRKKARVGRGEYLCNHCKNKVPASIVVNGKRCNNIYVDHIDPIIDPEVGFVSWDNVIERMFVDEDKLQVLCKNCHDIKTKEERVIAKEKRRG